MPRSNFLKRLFRGAEALTPVIISAPNSAAPPGYHRLTDAPEVAAAVWRIGASIAALPIQLWENGKNGDTRIRDNLARKLDVEPWALATRSVWMGWIVSTLCTKGEAFVLPRTSSGYLIDLPPMPGAVSQAVGPGYEVSWNGQTFAPDEVLHFRLRPDPEKPWKGLSPAVQLDQIVSSLLQAEETKTAYMSSEYKPPLIVAVNTDSPLSDKVEREAFLKNYFDAEPGTPWVIPADLMNVSQVKPLSLNDLAIRDGVELDKKTVASIFGVPGFLVGVGSYSRDEFNTYVSDVLLPICKGIAQELTAKLIGSPGRYVKFNTRSLYSYSLGELAEIADEQYVRGLMTGNEARDWLGLAPMDGLDELVMLENYIPASAIGQQKKLNQEEPANG